MTEQSVGVEVELRVQSHDLAFAVAVQRVDFNQRRVGFHVALVQLLEDVHGLCGGISRHADGVSDLLGLGIAQTGQRIDELGDDFLGGGVGHFLNVHAAFAGSDERDLLGGAVRDHGHVIFFVDVSAVFDVQAADFLAFGASLVGLELHAQDLARDAFDVFNRLGHFHTAPFATATGVDLGLDHPNGATQLLCRLNRFLNGESRDTAGNGHAELTQDFLALVFVDFHELSLRMDGY